MAFTDNIKQIAPALTQIKTGTPGFKIGSNYLVGGIGGNFIPNGFANVAAGYITISDSIVTLHDITNNTTKIINELYITDTGVDEPAYQGGSGGGESFYKCASVDTANEEWTGYKLIMLDGEYTYEQGVTTGLTYSYVTPEVGTVYNSNALIVVKTVIVPSSGPASPVNLNGYTDSEGWTVSASSEYSNGQHAAWKAFKNTQTGITWLSNENVNYPHWLKWKNLQPTVLIKYRFKANTSAGYNKELTAWELQASNDDFSTYVVLDERSGIRWSSGELKSFEVTQNVGRYTAYRLYCVSGNSTNYVAISEFETNWE